MRSSNQRQWLPATICIVSILTAAVIFASPNNRFALAAAPVPSDASASQAALEPRSFPDNERVEPAVAASVSASAVLVSLPAHVPPAAEAAPAPASDRPVLAAATSRNEPARIESPEVPKPPSADTYEVSAYFLNVRSEPNAESRILHVAEQGDKLSVVGRTDDGWLELEGSGYVHGKYAFLVEESASDDRVKTKREVATASYAVQAVPAPDDARRAADAPGGDEPPADDAGPVAPTSEVESDSGLTADHIATILEGTALSDHGLEEAILEVEDEYGINAFFTIAVMKLESGNGKSKLARDKNNLFGLNAATGQEHKAFSFETKADSVMRFGKLLANSYVDKGYRTIEKVGTKYCPANGKWPSLVKNIMKRDYKLII